jgi:uncharacterized protein YbaP (TraB family)
MKKVTLILFLLICVFTKPFAQPPNEADHLLWRITGNGLSRPSYLFGTMHLTDKRLFYFGDSLYRVLEQTEGFAAELDMNTVFTQYISSLMNDEKVKKYLDKTVEKNVLKKYKSQLEDKFKKPVSKISTDDLDKEEQKQTMRWLQSGEMKTFMDAYLFDIAARQGKWTGGIEDAEDQFGLSEAVNPEDRIESMFTNKFSRTKGIEWMIDTYRKEDLTQIDRSDEIWKGSKDIVLLKRNVKMSYRIDSLAHVRTCLFAIGAAHLPGDSGVISLLRKKGFTVTPVISSKKIAPEDYTYKEKERAWVDVSMRDSLFSVQMPAKPLPFTPFQSSFIDMQFYFDLGSYSAFFSIGIPANISSAKARDSIFDRIAANYKEKVDSFSIKDIRIGDAEGKELLVTNDYGDYRIQMFAPGDYVAMNAVFGLKKQSLFDTDAERYFNSFRPGLTTGREKKETAGKWQQYNIEEHAFSIDLPGAYRSRDEKGNEEGAWLRKFYETFDIAAQSYYGIVVDQTGEGYYSDKDTVYFNDATKSVAESMKAEIIYTNDTVFQQYPARNLVLKGQEDGTVVITKIFFVNRGNRRYMLFKSYDPRATSTATDDRFFSSFAFLPVINKNWKHVTAPDNSFTTWAPGDFKIKKDTASTLVTRYMVYDKQAAVTAIVDKETFPAYYWVDSDTSLYSERIKTFVNWNDSLISRTDTRNGNTKGVEVSIWLRESQNIKKMRMLLNGDTLYTIFCFLPAEAMNTGYEKLFDEFRIKNEQKPERIFISKINELLGKLKSNDSTEFYSAKELLNKVRFKKTDVPLLQQALLHVYKDFDTAYYYYANANSILAGKIKELDSTYTSIEFIRDKYSTLTNEKEVLKPVLLSILSSQKTTASYKLTRELLSKQPPAIKAPYYFTNNLGDSLLLAKTLFPDILSAIENEGLGNDIADLTVTMLDSNVISPKMIVDAKAILVRAAKRELARPANEKEDHSYEYYSIVRLLAEINDNETNSLLRRFALINDLELKLEVFTFLIRNNQPVSRTELVVLAKSDQHRHSLYDKLKDYKKLKMFPAEFLTQKLLGQSKVYQEANDEDAPEKISYVGERIAMFNGQKKKFYLYKIIYDAEEPDDGYLGIAGPYALDPKDVTSSHDCTGLYWTENYDAKQIDKQFKDHLKRMEEYLVKQPGETIK